MQTIESIKEVVETFFDIDLGSKKRDNMHFRTRSIFYKLCFNYTHKPTYQAVGDSVNRDHSTVIYSVRTFDDNIKYDKELRDMYDCLKQTFKEFEGEKVSLSELIKNNFKLKKSVSLLKLELDQEKLKNSLISEYKEVSLINSLMNDLDDEEKCLLACKLKALYNLNKGRVKTKLN